MTDDKTPEPMGPATASERAYREIKRLLMEEYWPRGTHLHPGKIAKMLSITKSSTAVREALYRLYGEGMVAHMEGRGFYVP
jgi:DNA-binding GntR family transcriptional regulator